MASLLGSTIVLFYNQFILSPCVNNLYHYKEADLKDSNGKVEGLKHDLQLASNVYEKMLQQHRDSEKKLRQVSCK